jgi:hypothetical protein
VTCKFSCNISQVKYDVKNGVVRGSGTIQCYLMPFRARSKSLRDGAYSHQPAQSPDSGSRDAAGRRRQHISGPGLGELLKTVRAEFFLQSGSRTCRLFHVADVPQVPARPSAASPRLGSWQPTPGEMECSNICGRKIIRSVC